jgi:hypothetical protein
VVLSHAIRAGKAADKVIDALDTASDLYKAADNLPISNPVPKRMARVFDAELLGSASTLGAPWADDVFVTAADDITGITSSQELAKRLTLLDNNGKLVPGPFAVLEFDTPSAGVASPILRDNLGFVGKGRTAGGAREFVIPNTRLDKLENLIFRRVE